MLLLTYICSLVIHRHYQLLISLTATKLSNISHKKAVICIIRKLRPSYIKQLADSYHRRSIEPSHICLGGWAHSAQVAFIIKRSSEIYLQVQVMHGIQLANMWNSQHCAMPGVHDPTNSESLQNTICREPICSSWESSLNFIQTY